MVLTDRLPVGLKIDSLSFKTTIRLQETASDELRASLLGNGSKQREPVKHASGSGHSHFRQPSNWPRSESVWLVPQDRQLHEFLGLNAKWHVRTKLLT